MRIGIQRREPACCDSLSLQLRTKNTIPTPRNPFRTLPRFVRAGSGKPRKNTVGERSPQRPGPVPFAAWNFRAIAKALRLRLSDHVADPADRPAILHDVCASSAGCGYQRFAESHRFQKDQPET